VIANAIKVAGAFLLLIGGADVVHIAAVVTGSLFIVFAVEATLVLKRIDMGRMRLDLQHIRSMIRSLWVFALMDGFIALFGSIEVLLLSRMTTEADVGLYSAAAQLMIPLTLVYRSVVMSAFPMLVRRAQESGVRIAEASEHLLTLLLALAVPAAVGLYFMSERALLLLYGRDDIRNAAVVLQIIAGTLVFRAGTWVLGYVLIATRNEHLTLRIVFVDALVSLIGGVILIYAFGLAGASMTSLLTVGVDLLQHCLYVAQKVPAVRFPRLALASLGASAGMAAYLAALGQQDLALVTVSATALYLVLFLALVSLLSDGLRSVWTSYRQTWAESAGPRQMAAVE
jgi:O-antigen/teichoic acid export membrane protein